MRLRPLLFPLALLALTTSSFAASFDCKLAHTRREKTICADAKLSALDSDLATAYKAASTRLSAGAFTFVHDDQVEWLKWLDFVCPANLPKDTIKGSVSNCLTTEYTSRLQQFTASAQTAPGAPHFYPRYKVVYFKGAHDAANPDFGSGNFAWPQIDDTTPSAIGFNKAVAAAVLKLTADSLGTTPTNLEHSVTDATGYITTNFSIGSDNDNLIEVILGSDAFNWGGAHPDYVFASFHWLPYSQRPLATGDIFNAATAWKTALAGPAIAKLKANKNVADMILAEGDDLKNGVAKSIADPTTWILANTGLTVVFQPGTITAVAAGEPTISFPWKELQPFLAKNFDPAKLPIGVPYQH